MYISRRPMSLRPLYTLPHVHPHPHLTETETERDGRGRKVERRREGKTCRILRDINKYVW